MFDIPLLLPIRRSVSFTISLLILLKSEKIFPLLWRNSPYSKWKHSITIKDTVSPAERCDFVGVKLHELFQVCRICGKAVVFYNMAQYGSLYHKSPSPSPSHHHHHKSDDGGERVMERMVQRVVKGVVVMVVEGGDDGGGW